jgi:hypothetical protein
MFPLQLKVQKFRFASALVGAISAQIQESGWNA